MYGNLESKWFVVSSDSLSHHGVKGMKWGVRRQEKRAAKDSYKSTKKELRKESNKRWNDYRNREKAVFALDKVLRSANKSAYKEGKISKEQFKRNKKNARHNRIRELERAEVDHVIGMYSVQRAKRANKLTYVKTIKGENSKAYKRGIKAWNKQTEYYGMGNSTYTIRKKSDGSYSISRTDVYIY